MVFVNSDTGKNSCEKCLQRATFRAAVPRAKSLRLQLGRLGMQYDMFGESNPEPAGCLNPQPFDHKEVLNTHPTD